MEKHIHTKEEEKNRNRNKKKRKSRNRSKNKNSEKRENRNQNNEKRENRNKVSKVEPIETGKPNKKISKKKRKNRKRKRIILLILLILIMLLGIFIGLRIHRADGNLLAALLGHNKTTRQNLEKLQVLILGESTGMSDTIVVAQYDPKNQEAALLSIPRDTFVGKDIKHARSSDKINAKYSHGETIDETLAAVNELTGLNIKNYVLVDTKALNKLVDVIGGLEFDVPMDMNYDDGTQNLHIHLKAGYQKLTGNQVEQLVRFRHNNNGSSYYKVYGVGEDFGRMQTQRNVIMALAKQTLKFKNVTEIFNIIDIFKDYVKTNMNLDDIKDYVPYAFEMNMDNIKTGQVPGSDGPSNIGIYVFVPDKEATKELVDELFNGPKQPEETEGNNTLENNTLSNDD